MNEQEHINKDHDEEIEELKNHARVANEEMGLIKQDIAILKTDMAWVRDAFKTMDARVWWILGSIIGMGLLQIIIRYLWK